MLQATKKNNESIITKPEYLIHAVQSANSYFNIFGPSTTELDFFESLVKEQTSAEDIISFDYSSELYWIIKVSYEYDYNNLDNAYLRMSKTDQMEITIKCINFVHKDFEGYSDSEYINFIKYKEGSKLGSCLLQIKVEAWSRGDGKRTTKLSFRKK